MDEFSMTMLKEVPQRKSDLSLTSRLLALEAAMEPCTAIYTAVKV